jgi:hypothetical protein
MTDLEQQLTDHLRSRAAAATPRYDLEGIEQATNLLSLIDLEDHRRRRPKTRTIVGLVAVAAAVIAIATVTIPSDKTTVSVPADESTVPTSAPAPGGGSAFAAAIEASGVLTSPSTDEVDQAMDGGLYHDTGPAEVSTAGNFVSLRSCRARASATCGTGWAYVTGTTAGVGVHGGVLSEARYLDLDLLDDRYFVAAESTAFDAPPPSKAWLIDAVSGRAGALSWRDEPTTMNSPEQELLLWHDSPYVIDARDGTIRPLAGPDDLEAGLTVEQHGTGRIWVGTDPGGDGHGLGLAYSDDGGASWSDVALPEDVRSTTVAPDTSVDPDLRIAADGDRVAVTAWWGTERRAVYVSDDAGRSWTIATTPSERGEGNAAYLYVLADGRLVLMWSMDAVPQDLLVSTGSDWSRLESHFSDREAGWKYFSVNRAGIALVPSFIDECATSCLEGDGGQLLDSIDFGIDLKNWSTIKILDG